MSWSNLKRGQASVSSSDDEPNSKRVRSEKSRATPSPLADEGAWRILFQYLTTEMTYPQMEEEFLSYLGDRYCAEDWKDARDALFSADDLNDDATPLANLQALYAKHVTPQSSLPSDIAGPSEDSPAVVTPVRTPGHSSAYTRKSRSHRRPTNPYIDAKAQEDSTEEEAEALASEAAEGNRSVRSPLVTSLSGPSAKQTFLSTIDNIFDKVNTSKTLDRRLHYRAAWSPGTIQSRMYLLCVHRSATPFIAKHLRNKGLPVTVSPWVPGQLYVVSDSLKNEEREAVEHACPKLPNPGWVRITQGKYRGDIGYVYDSKQLNDFVAVLIPPREFPYPALKNSAALFNRSRLPANKTVSDILRDGKVIGCSCIYNPDGTHFIKATELAFSMQFLRVSDDARVITGEDVERMFRLGDSVRVVAGIYLGLEGHVIQMYDDVFHVCQESTKEEVEVSKYYLDCRPLTHTLQLQLPTQELYYVEVLEEHHKGKHGTVSWCSTSVLYLWPGVDSTSIMCASDSEAPVTRMIKVPSAWAQRIYLAPTIKYTKDKGYDVRPGDFVNVTRGPEYQTTGVVQSVDLLTARLALISQTDKSLINVPIRFVVKLHNASLDTFKNIIGKEVFIIGGEQKGYRAMLYDVGNETCSVAIHGQRRITLKHSDVVTSVTPPPEKVIASSGSNSIACPNTQSSESSILGTWTANPQVIARALNHSLTVNSITSSESTSWTVNPEDNEARQENIQDNGPLSWLMRKEFSSILLEHHAMLKVSPSFMGGKLHKRFVSTACPDPFCSVNGPAPENCIAAFCTSNGAGAAIEHYHIPAHDLSLAPPCRKNQQCLVLDGDHRGDILTIEKCNTKKNTVEVYIDSVVPVATGSVRSTLPTRNRSTLRFNQICVLEPSSMQPYLNWL
ncbi:hypothetical protein EV702DRAFT_1049328 [Suillus placidus]|uniref:KOW domain-containing protein n=1 Tax=Suillus placidus TaxID=48579 RepID=A0A9P6ZKY5_9AGAM|nr:hypothetical protein EV702DRAFT_1049328 [Suillus placidus]